MNQYPRTKRIVLSISSGLALVVCLVLPSGFAAPAAAVEVQRTIPSPYAVVEVLHPELADGQRFLSADGAYLIYSGADRKTYRRELRTGVEMSVGNGSLVSASPDASRVLVRADSSWSLWKSGSVKPLPTFPGTNNVYHGNSRMQSFIVVAGNPGPAIPATNTLYFYNEATDTSVDLSALSGQGAGFYQAIYVREDGTKAYFSYLGNRDGIFEYSSVTGAVSFLPLGPGRYGNGAQLPYSVSDYGRMQIAFNFPNNSDRALMDMESLTRMPIEDAFDPNGTTQIEWASSSGFAVSSASGGCSLRTGYSNTSSWTTYTSSRDCDIRPAFGNEAIWMNRRGPISLYRVPMPLSPGVDRRLQVTGVAGVPSNADAVVLNMTVVNAQAPGFATVYPCGQPRPEASNLNYSAGQTIPNLVIAKPGDGGKVCIYSYAAIDVLADVSGFFPAGSGFTPISNPTRVLDTRNGIGAPAAPVGAGSTLQLQATGTAGVPSNADAVVLNMTVVNAQAPGFATVYPCGQPRPEASNLNYSAGQTIPNLVIAKPGDGGKVCIYSYATIDVLADVSGFFPAGSGFTPISNPTRVLDTRNGI